MGQGESKLNYQCQSCGSCDSTHQCLYPWASKQDYRSQINILKQEHHHRIHIPHNIQKTNQIEIKDQLQEKDVSDNDKDLNQSKIRTNNYHYRPYSNLLMKIARDHLHDNSFAKDLQSWYSRQDFMLIILAFIEKQTDKIDQIIQKYYYNIQLIQRNQRLTLDQHFDLINRHKQAARVYLEEEKDVGRAVKILYNYDKCRQKGKCLKSIDKINQMIQRFGLPK